MNINYEYYRIFYYVARYGSFTKAANALGSNQPNVTRAMNNLEEAMGCKLFERSNHGIALTPEGSQLLTHVTVAVEQLQVGEGELSAGAILAGGSVSIGTSETALNIFLLDKLKKFHDLYPGIRLKITNHSTPQAIRALGRGMVDLAVVSTPAEVEKPFYKKELMKFQDVLVKLAENAGNEIAEKTSLDLTEIAELPIIMLGEGTGTRDFYEKLFVAKEMLLRPDFEVATTDQILPLVRSGLGYGFVPEPMARAGIESGELKKISLREEIPERSVVLIYDRHRPLSAAAKELLKVLG